MSDNAALNRIENSFSSRCHRWLIYTAAEVNGSLVDELRFRLPHIPHDEMPERLAWGGVFVNGIEVNGDMPLPIPCKLEYYEPRFAIHEAADFFPAFSTEHVLYEDEYLLALFKPAKLPTYPGKEQKYYNVRVYAEKYTGLKVHLPSRLDMSTSGVMLMSKHADTHNSLQRLYENSLIRKTYILGTAGEVTWETFDHQGAIGKDPRHAVLRCVVAEGGKQSRTIFTRLGTVQSEELNSPITFVAAEPRTGRTHQIRVHVSDLGLPIVGDNFYGGVPAKSLHLMAYSLEFQHPKGHKSVRIEVPRKLFPEWLPAQLQLPTNK